MCSTMGTMQNNPSIRTLVFLVSPNYIHSADPRRSSTVSYQRQSCPGPPVIQFSQEHDIEVYLLCNDYTTCCSTGHYLIFCDFPVSKSE